MSKLKLFHFLHRTHTLAVYNYFLVLLQFDVYTNYAFALVCKLAFCKNELGDWAIGTETYFKSNAVYVLFLRSAIL